MIESQSKEMLVESFLLRRGPGATPCAHVFLNRPVHQHVFGQRFVCLVESLFNNRFRDFLAGQVPSEPPATDWFQGLRPTTLQSCFPTLGMFHPPEKDVST